MTPYSNYNAVNSRTIRPYKGIPLPELMKVSEEMQRRYDVAQDQQDYVSRFLSSLDAMPEDKPELNKLREQFKGKLQTISARPDAENTLRETALLARDLPQAYAPFANKLKQYKEYEKSVMENGKLLPQTKEEILTRALNNKCPHI